jgi:hypothetical protein
MDKAVRGAHGMGCGTGGAATSSPAATGCTCGTGSHSIGWASWARPSRAASGRFQVEWAAWFKWSGPIILFFYFLRFSKFSNAYQLEKYERVVPELQKFPNFACYKMNLKGINFYFGRSPNVKHNLN